MDTGRLSRRIVETEAYPVDDSAQSFSVSEARTRLRVFHLWVVLLAECNQRGARRWRRSSAACHRAAGRIRIVRRFSPHRTPGQAWKGAGAIDQGIARGSPARRIGLVRRRTALADGWPSKNRRHRQKRAHRHHAQRRPTVAFLRTRQSLRERRQEIALIAFTVAAAGTILSAASRLPLNPLPPPGRRLERVREILRFMDNLPGAKLHDANGVRHLPLVLDGVFGDPEISVAEDTLHLEAGRLSRMVAPQGLQISSPRMRSPDWG